MTSRRGAGLSPIPGAGTDAGTGAGAETGLAPSETGLVATVDWGAVLAESLTGASLVTMSDKFTPHPKTEELLAAGVPAEIHPMLGKHGMGSLVSKMGIVFTQMSTESMVATMPVDGNTQVTGLLHGGAHVVLAETLGSFAAAFHAGPNSRVVGIEINATHHRAATEGLVTGTATPIHLGRTLTTHEVVMRNEAGQRLSTCRITNMILSS